MQERTAMDERNHHHHQQWWRKNVDHKRAIHFHCVNQRERRTSRKKSKWTSCQMRLAVPMPFFIRPICVTRTSIINMYIEKTLLLLWFCQFMTIIKIAKTEQRQRSKLQCIHLCSAGANEWDRRRQLHSTFWCCYNCIYRYYSSLPQLYK